MSRTSRASTLSYRTTSSKAPRQAVIDIAQLALQFSIANPRITTCIAGSADPRRIQQWAQCIEEPLDKQLLSEVLEILKPVHNWHHIEGRPENNDGV